MELQKIINNFDNYQHIHSNENLDKLFSEIDKFNFEDFFYFEYPFTDKYFKINKYFMEIDKELYDKTLNNETEEYFVSVIKSTIPYFEKALVNADIVSFLIFFRTNFFLKLDINHIIQNSCLESKFNSLLWCLAFELSKINISIMDLDSYYRSDEFIKKLKVELAAKKTDQLNISFKLINLENIRELTNPNKLVFSKLIMDLISFLKEQDSNLFVETLLELDNFLSIILFVKICHLEEISLIFKNNYINNEGLLFCFLKKILDSDYDNNVKYKSLTKNILFKIFELNKRLFLKLINIFQNNLMLTDSLGVFICDLKKNEMKVILDQFSIGRFNQKKDYMLKLLESCNEKSNEYSFLLGILHEKRKQYLKECLENDDIALNLENALTNLCSCDLNYFIKFYSGDEIIERIMSILNEIKYLLSKWFYSYTNLINKFYVDYSNLLILSIAFNYKNLKNDDINVLFDEIFMDEFIKDLFYIDDLDSINMIKSNFK